MGDHGGAFVIVEQAEQALGDDHDRQEALQGLATRGRLVGRGERAQTGRRAETAVYATADLDSDIRRSR
jgi:hypothetical protein